MPPCRCQGFTGPPIQGFPRLLTLLRSLSLHVGEDGACERSVRISAGTHDKKASRHMRWMSFGAHMKTIARRIRTALLLSALLLFGSLHGAEAGVNVWTTNGPEGGSISALAVDPQTPTTLYAGTTSAGVFKSIDGGTHWRAVNAGLGATTVRALAIDPQTPTALYAATWGGGVFKSTDGGANWSNISSGLIDPYGVRVSAIAAMAINPQTPTTLYAGTNQGVFKSTDGGSSWSAIRPGPGYTRALAIDSQPTTTLYAGTWAGGFKSTDGATNWNAVNTGLTNLTVETLAIDPDPHHPLCGRLRRRLQEHGRRRQLERRQRGPERDQCARSGHRSSGFHHPLRRNQRRRRLQKQRRWRQLERRQRGAERDQCARSGHRSSGFHHPLRRNQR